VDTVPLWLLVKAELRFNENLRPIFPRDYRADLLAEGSDVYYGVHFISAPPKVNPGDRAVVDLTFRAFPKDACNAFQAGTRVFLKEGPVLVRAEGTITRRWEYESASKTLIELQQELGRL
jgi:predicted RecA/RadA family phage recombinase